MNNRFGKRRVTSLLLVLAMLVVSVVSLLPMTASADGEIQNFGVQSLASIDLRDDDTTDLRFIFTVGSLDYEEVGVILSKTVATPTYDGANCFTKKMTTVYSTITADGEPMAAPTGRFWVACKMTGIPHDYFDGDFYVRAFVKPEGEDPIYSATETCTVCSVCEHVHVQPFDAEGTATLLSTGNLTGVCPGCGLSINFNGVTRTPVLFSSKSPNTRGAEGALLGNWACEKKNVATDGDTIYANKSFLLSKSVADIRGEDHFYPASTSVGAQGKDLWFEYSFLMDESFWNYNVYSSEMKIASFRKESGRNPTTDSYLDFYYLYARDKDYTDCPYRGHFDFSTYYPSSASCVHDFGGPVYLAGYAAWDPWPVRGDSPYLWDEVSQTTYGWHRIGFRFHQEVSKVSGSTVTYVGYSELYIDGVKVWEVGSNMQGNNDKSLGNKGLLLWTATASGGSITGYSDNDSMLVQMYLGNVMDSKNAVTVGVGDVFWTCGNGFVQSVSPVGSTPTGTAVENFFYTID